MKNLPDNTGIEMDFPFAGTSPDKLAILHWNDPDGDGNGEWVEVSQPLARNQITRALTVESADELYKLPTLIGNRFYPVLTTDQTGIFILVKK